MCDENVLLDIYQFLKALLKTEFKNICQKIISASDLANKKIKKIRKKTMNIITGAQEEKIIHKVELLQQVELLQEEKIIHKAELLQEEQITLEKQQKKRRPKKDVQLDIID